ncbi:TATA element modulatory factor 1 [Mactra antiquata]
MSWWNSSNFSDLASKALKNAQKQIDKALDIKDQQNAGSAGAATGGTLPTSEAEKNTNKEKGSVWGGWMAETSESGSDNKSAWSFPWGGNVESAEPESQTEFFVQEKTAEEIKSEVLKAAKERTKAKSKLFPQKSKSESPKPEEKSDAVVKHSEKEEERDRNVVLDSGVVSEESNMKNKTDLEELSLVSEGKMDIKTDDYHLPKVSDSPDISESDSKVAELTVDDTKDVDEGIMPRNSSLTESDFQEVTEDNLEPSDKLLVKSMEVKDTGELTESDENDQNVYQKKQSETSSDNAKSEWDIHLDKVTEVTDSPEPLQSESSKDDSKLLEVVEESKDVESAETNQEEMIRNLSSGDISSSVEFINDKDIIATENMVTPEDDSIVSQTYNSDPELLDFDKEKDGIDNETKPPDNEKTSVECESEIENITGIGLQMGGMTETDLCDKIESDFLLKTDTKVIGSLETSADTGLLEVTKSLASSDSESSMNKLDSSMDTCASGDTIVEQMNNVINKEDEIKVTVPDQGVFTELTVDVDCGLTDKELDLANVDTSTHADTSPASDYRPETDVTDGDLEKTNISPAHSFVKCMLDDVTEEGKHRDDNSDSQKSEGSRSVYSNQESGDEVDTTTSSDIEIISLPTPNGENRQGSPLDPIPLRMALQKTNWRGSPTHRRTDSSDSSNASGGGGNSELSPGRESIDYEHEGHKQDLPALNEEDDNNPYHPQKLLKDDPIVEDPCDIGSTGQISPVVVSISNDLTQAPNDVQTDTNQKLAEMSEILQAREDKLLTLSKENCDLMETNSILRNQLKQSEEAREAEMTDVNELTAEFTTRLTESEKRLNTAIREKDTLKKQLQDTQAELAKRSGDVSLKEILAEKEEQIAGLLEEGEKLSKSQLQSNTIIKKLRQKEKDNESTLTSQKKKIETQKEELDHLHKVLESKEELEKKQTDAISQLNAAVKRLEQEMVKYKSDCEDATEKARGLQVALDNSYKEMAELHRNTAALDSRAQEAALSAEMQVREELKLTIEKQQNQHKWTVDTLNMQIEDHRLSMARMEKEYNRREDLLKQEISDLQKQLQEDEARNQELTQGVSLATRPLLRQIENLQSTYNAQSSTWEKVERSLSDRLSESQNQLAIAAEKERTATEQVIDLSSKVTSLETQNTRFRQERSQLNAELEMLKTKVELSEDAKQNEAAQVEVFKQQMAQEIHELKKQKVMLETELDIEKSKLEQEKKKILMLQDQLKDTERDLQRSKSRTPVRATPSPISVSRQDSMIGSLHEQSFTAITQDELDRSFVLASPNGNKHSLYETLRQSGAANLLENLQSQLKLREGEIAHLQSEIRSLERTRESMAKELVDLSNKNDDLEEKLKDMPVLEEQFKDLDQRYNALLQMYGEKVEEADELKLDLQDVKDMYKAQINHLLSQS